jgi:heme-degrading monooxygenase HmoA
MPQAYTTGSWKPAAGKQDMFVAAWSEFAAWASGLPGAGTLRLARDTRDPQRFVSFAAWDSIEAVRAWKSAPDFRERLAPVLQHVAEFEPSELEVVAAAEKEPEPDPQAVSPGLSRAHLMPDPPIRGTERAAGPAERETTAVYGPSTARR